MSIEHCMSGAAEHMEARRKEAFKQRQAKIMQKNERERREEERLRGIDRALYEEQTKRQTAERTDAERRQLSQQCLQPNGNRDYPQGRWESAKMPRRFNNKDYTSQW